MVGGGGGVCAGGLDVELNLGLDLNLNLDLNLGTLWLFPRLRQGVEPESQPSGLGQGLRCRCCYRCVWFWCVPQTGE